MNEYDVGIPLLALQLSLATPISQYVLRSIRHVTWNELIHCVTSASRITARLIDWLIVTVAKLLAYSQLHCVSVIDIGD
jgi:hypothetical protein